MKETTVGRREFLRLAAASTAVTTIALTASGAKVLRSESEAAEETSPYRWGMVINLNKCIGCGNCTLACQAHNDMPEHITWNRMIEVGEYNGAPVYTPVPCMHCENAPCVDICPVKATYHRPDGIVAMDYERCIGCRYCEMACPYGARTFNWEEFTGDNPTVPEWGEPEVERRPRGVVEKCSFCFNRIDRGLAQGFMPGIDRDATPACVNACPTGARVFGDLNDPDSPVSQILRQHPSVQLRKELGTMPRVYYIPNHNEPDAPEEEVIS